MQSRINNLDYLGARLHGRRSQLAEAERLKALCELPNIRELGRVVAPETGLPTAKEFQRRCVQDLVRELTGCLGHLEGTGADLLTWMLVRYQVENIKVLLRGFLNHTALATLGEYLVELPQELALEAEALAAAESLEALVELLPPGTPRNRLREAVGLYREQPRPFFLEAALDCGYFQELLARTAALRGDDKELIEPMVVQEVETFHLMLVVRGKFQYGLTPELLRPFHVHWPGIASDRFNAMLAAPDPRTAAGYSVGRALDRLPPELAASQASAAVELTGLEALAWRRFLRLANRAFRRSHMGLAAIIGYAGIRRVEVANLITVSEGIRMGIGSEAIRARLIPRGDL